MLLVRPARWRGGLLGGLLGVLALTGCGSQERRPPSAVVAEPVRVRPVVSSPVVVGIQPALAAQRSPAVSAAQGSAPDNEGYSPATAYSNDVCRDGLYPPQWQWNPDTVQTRPAPATSGKPLIRQIRKGVVIATYDRLGAGGNHSVADNTDAHDTTTGPFHRTPHQQWLDGDVFELAPAVYDSGDLYIGPNVRNYQDYLAGKVQIPKNITVRGLTVNGVRPVIKNTRGAANDNYGQSLVYVDASENITIENLDIVDDPQAPRLGKAAVYVNGAKNLTLRNVRIAGFHVHSANGLFATGNNSGTLTLENIELDGNGGGDGPEHNAYINASTLDNQYTVRMVASWSHGSRYGHLFKSRAQRTVLEGNYFQGSRSENGEMRESWLVDVPDGGVLIARNNLFAKNASGDFTNGGAITFAVERGGQDTPFDRARPWEVVIEHNTFVNFARYYDTQHHENFPFFLNPAAPVPAWHVRANLFVGYCQPPSPHPGERGYRGVDDAQADFNAIDQAFRPRKPEFAASDRIVGTSAYAHRQQANPRKSAAKGARD